MDMSFFDRLRKNNLFTDDNPNPIGPPAFNAPINVGNTINAALMARQSEREDARNYALKQQNIMNGMRYGQQPQIDSIAGGPPQNVVFDRRGDSADEFAKNILNPPERAFKFQDLANKRDLALRGMDLKENLGQQGLNLKAGDLGVKQERANTSQYSAETRRQLADLHDLPDSDKLRLLQEGKVTIQHLKDAAELAAIRAKGEEGRKTVESRGDQNIRSIKERGEQTRYTNTFKPVSATQIGAEQKNAVRNIMLTRPDLAKYIIKDENGQQVIDPNTPENEMKMIQGMLSGEFKDKKLPSDKSSKKDNDPLGIRK